MTIEEFNEKYNAYLEKGHYGLAINIPAIIDYMDNEFQNLIKLDGFQFSQIKAKFGHGRFYCDGVPSNVVEEIEAKITELCEGGGKERV